LKGAGASIALPLLDAMIPARTLLAQTPALAGPRLGFVYFPHGALQDQWQPKQTGRDFEFPFILEPLKPLREHLTVVSGLRNKGGESSSPHGIIEETWLNCISPRQRNPKTGVGVTVDQIAARHLGKDTPLPSMELCGEAGGMISFRTPQQALPMESNPRKVFVGMFGQGDTAEERQAILKTTNSLLDYVRESTAALNRTLDAETAEEIVKLFTEVIIAPDVTEEAKSIIARKPNLRLLAAGGLPDPPRLASLLRPSRAACWCRAATMAWSRIWTSRSSPSVRRHRRNLKT